MQDDGEAVSAAQTQDRVTVVVNARAGALLADPPRMRATLEEAFAARSRPVELHMVEPSDLAAALADAAARQPALLVAGGGDGTAVSAAGHLLGTHTALGVLPLGTVNRLARDLGMPLDPAAACQAILDGEVTRMDIGRVNGRLFLNNSLLGLPIEVMEARQRLRGRPWHERMQGALTVAWRVMTHRNRFMAEIEGVAERFRVRAMSIAICNNAYEEAPHVPHLRAVLDGNELVLYVSKHEVGWKLVRSFLRSLAGSWSDDANVEIHRMPRMTLHARRKTVRVTLDGEIETLETPLRYAVEPRALAVVKARRSAVGTFRGAASAPKTRY